MSAAEDLFRQARALSEEERRALAERLLETVENDPLLAAIAAAPIVALTEHERAAIAEVESDPTTSLTTERIAATLADGEEDALDTPALVAELDRREAAIAAGGSALVPAEDVHAAMRARREARRAGG